MLPILVIQWKRLYVFQWWQCVPVYMSIQYHLWAHKKLLVLMKKHMQKFNRFIYLNINRHDSNAAMCRYWWQTLNAIVLILESEYWCVLLGNVTWARSVLRILDSTCTHHLYSLSFCFIAYFYIILYIIIFFNVLISHLAILTITPCQKSNTTIIVSYTRYPIRQ